MWISIEFVQANSHTGICIQGRHHYADRALLRFVPSPGIQIVIPYATIPTVDRRPGTGKPIGTVRLTCTWIVFKKPLIRNLFKIPIFTEYPISFCTQYIGEKVQQYWTSNNTQRILPYLKNRVKKSV